eukprot:4485584-Ditylum_brightwellii.AAC.1
MLEYIYNAVPSGAILTCTTCVVLACTLFSAPLTHTTCVILVPSSWVVVVLLQRLCLVQSSFLLLPSHCAPHIFDKAGLPQRS